MNRPSGRADRGSTAIEFAIIVPVLMLFVLGMLEFSLVMRDYLSVSGSTKAAARIASTQAAAGDAICPNPLPDPSYVCAPAARAPELAISAVNAIQTGATAMPQDYVNFVWVYKANAAGWPGTATNAATAAPLCDTTGNNCVKFRWNKAANRFQYSSGSWDSKTIDACLTVTDPITRVQSLNPNAQSVGVYIDATHPFITKLFGASIGIQNRVALKFDPLETRSCNGLGIGNGGHQ